jgi:acyl-CoA synthetase (AMP-forming)/AMP-acid ligase II
MVVTELIDHTALQYPRRLAFSGSGGEFTYSQLTRLSNQVGNKLVNSGYMKGDKFAIFTPNCGIAVIAQLGAIKAGLAWCNVNLKNVVADNIDILGRGECDVLFYHSSVGDTAREIQIGAPSIQLMVCLDKPDGDAPYLIDWLADASDESPGIELSSADDIGLQGATGGTTGLPKLTQSPQAMLGMGVYYLGTLMAVENIPLVNLCVAPITHASGLVCLGTLVAGGTNIMMASANIEGIIDHLQNDHVTNLFLPPTLVYELLKHRRIRDSKYPDLRYLLTAGAPIAAQKIAEAISVFGPVMCQVFAQSEAGMPVTFISPDETATASADPAKRHLLQSCGKKTGMIDEIAIMDAAGNLLPPGKSGEIVLRGPTIMKGYLNDPEATAQVQAFGWHHSGDVGYLDEDGYLFINDRMRDMIISGGFNIFPLEIEQVLFTHPCVQECAVVGVVDDKWGEAVTGVIVLAPGASFDEQELITFCKDALGSMKAPKSIVLIDSMPRSAVGKVLKRKIRDGLNAQADSA